MSESTNQLPYLILRAGDPIANHAVRVFTTNAVNSDLLTPNERARLELFNAEFQRAHNAYHEEHGTLRPLDLDAITVRVGPAVQVEEVPETTDSTDGGAGTEVAPTAAEMADALDGEEVEALIDLEGLLSSTTPPDPTEVGRFLEPESGLIFSWMEATDDRPAGWFAVAQVVEGEIVVRDEQTAFPTPA